MDFEYIIDSHVHWGPSITLGTEVTTKEIQSQQRVSGITHVIIMPFPSTAIESNEINILLLEETKRVHSFIPYHYIRENYDTFGFEPIPDGYYGGKWHWMRGWQDAASNYKVLEDEALPPLIEKLKKTGKPIIFEEELRFTEIFVEMAEDLKIIIPHLGLLGGNPISFLKSFKNNENIFFDTALSSQGDILKFVETIGAHRVIFASDVPFGRMENELSKILSLPVTRDEKELILYKNIIKLARLNSENQNRFPLKEFYNCD
ncbi:MAG: amidohydrolase family protein [Syntrophorhabdaceae bacterium]|nr:amidohydrolase family protein [Syntrophorhabdaceae bacterium]